MDKRYLAFGLAFALGCTTTPKPAESFKAAEPDPASPYAAGVETRFDDFLKMRNLASTPAAEGQAARLTAGWKPGITFAPDPTKGGDPVPGLVARAYVFGPDESVPLAADGELVAGVWDLDAKDNGGKPKLLELWHIDRETLKKFRRKDPVGDGFSLFFPWSNYHVDLKRVNVVLRFNGADGRNVTTAAQTLVLDHSATLQRAAEQIGPQAEAALRGDLPPLPVKFGPDGK